MHIVEQNIKQSLQSLAVPSDAVIIVALSGGADSVCLLAALAALGYNCRAAHCNFHLRGAESDRDMRFCQEFCRTFNVALDVRHFDVEQYRQVHDASVEMACRDLRYRWFEQLLGDTGAQYVAVAHHRDDNIETMMLNMLRGSGLAGVAAMHPLRQHILRPMLQCARAQIEDYMSVRGLNYVTDSTNASSEFRRNRLRNSILPLVYECFPGGDEALAHTLEHLDDNRTLFADLVESKRRAYFSDGTKIDIRNLIDSENHPALLLYEFLHPYGFNRTQTDCIIAAATSPAASGQRFTGDGACVAELSRGVLALTSSADAPSRAVAIDIASGCQTPVCIRTRALSPEEFAPRRDAAVIYFDRDLALAPGNVWTLRPWRRADRIAPFGAKGTSLVSDILRDARYDAAQKRNTWVLECNGTIVWVVGLRASRHFCVTPDTARILQLRLEV